MTISTSLFHQSVTRDLSKINEKISNIQEQVSSGKNDPRPSADPVRALRLSAAQEQDEALNRFSSNIDRAQLRLDLADTVLKEGVNTIRRVSELAVRSASDSVTTTERESIAIEVKQLRGTLLGLANTRDDFGQPLFGGYMTQMDPFEDGPNGVTYVGDGGRSKLQTSETTALLTGISGDQVFRGGTNNQGEDIFAVIDGFIAQLNTKKEPRDEQIMGKGSLTLQPALERESSDWGFDISGPQGTARVQFTAAKGAVSSAVTAINALTPETGVTASLDGTSGAIVLATDGEISVSGLDSASNPITVQDDKGQPITLIPNDQTRPAILDKLQDSTNHLIDQRTTLGALSATAELQSNIIVDRQVSLSQTMSNLEDLDLTDALTRLQQSTLTRDATLQAYVKITQKNLFDYMR